MSDYEILVNNIGVASRSVNPIEAGRQFSEWVDISKSGRGRAGGEPVTLLKDGEPVWEYIPDNDDILVRATAPANRWTRGQAPIIIAVKDFDVVVYPTERGVMVEIWDWQRKDKPLDKAGALDRQYRRD